MREFGSPRVTPRARSRSAVLAALLACACACVSAAGAAAAASNQSAPNPFALPPERLLAAGDPMPKTAFVDQTGAARTLDDFRGRTAVIGFVYTSCKDECPLITRKFGSLERLLPKDRFHLIEVSIDPAHDSPRVLAAYARRYDVDPTHRTLLTGTPAALDAFERQLGVSVIDNGHGTIIHNSRTIIVDAGGRIADIIDEAGWTPADVAADAQTVAGVAANPVDRIDLALGRTVANICGGIVNGRAGLTDLIAVVAIFGLSAWAMVWVSRKIFSGAS
jgi:protein SCO1/2